MQNGQFLDVVKTETRFCSEPNDAVLWKRLVHVCCRVVVKMCVAHHDSLSLQCLSQ